MKKSSHIALLAYKNGVFFVSLPYSSPHNPRSLHRVFQGVSTYNCYSMGIHIAPYKYGTCFDTRRFHIWLHSKEIFTLLWNMKNLCFRVSSHYVIGHTKFSTTTWITQVDNIVSTSNNFSWYWYSLKAEPCEHCTWPKYILFNNIHCWHGFQKQWSLVPLLYNDVIVYVL